MPLRKAQAEEWMKAVIDKLADKGDMAAESLKLASDFGVQGSDVIVVTFPRQYPRHLMALENAVFKAHIESVLDEVAGRPITLLFQPEPTPPVARKAPPLPPRPLPRPASPPSPPTAAEPEPALTAQLVKEYARLDQYWKQAEQQLTDLRMPVSAYLVFNTYNEIPDDDRTMVREAIGWQKPNKEWRLCFAEILEDESPDEISWKPLAECTLDVKVSAAKSFEALKGKVVVAGRAYLSKVQEANEALASVLNKN